MAKPPTLNWSSDATFTSGPESGQTTKLAPSAGYIAQGWVAGNEAPARYMNWALNRLSAWSIYLDNLPNETDFTNANFTWGGDHIFNGDVDFNDPVEFTDAVNFVVAPTFPAGFSAAGFVATPGDIGLGGPSNEVLYTDALGVSTARPRQVMINLADGVLSSNTGGAVHAAYIANSGYWTWPSTSGMIAFPIHVPRGAVLGNIRIGVSNQSGGTANVSVNYLAKAVNKTTPSSSTVLTATTPASQNISAGADHIFTLPTTVPLAIDNSIQEWFVTVTGQVDCRLHWIEVNYLDPGPRNG